MDMLGRFIMTVCICTIAVSVCDMLCTDGKFTKQIRLILTLVFVTGITAPVADLIKNNQIEETFYALRSYDGASNENSEVYRSYLKRTVEENINAEFCRILESEGITAEKICSEIYISEDYSISIIKAGIKCDDFTKAEEILRNRTGEEFEIWDMS